MKKRILNALTSKTAIIFYVTVAVTAFFGLTTNSFLGEANIRSLLIAMSYTGMMGVALTVLLIGGENDLAAGYESCLAGILLAFIIQAGVPWPLAILITLVIGALMGLLLVWFINVVGLPAFISSMGMMSVYGGVCKMITKNQNIQIDMKYADFFNLGQGALFGFIPYPFVIMIVLMLIYSFILRNTEFGRRVYMTGGNRTAARLAGIERKKMVAVMYINCGVIAALSGAVFTARMHNAAPAANITGGTEAITAAVLGGVAFKGGSGSIMSTFVGAALVTVFKAGLTASGLQAYWQVVVQGLLLVVALFVDYLNERALKKRLEG